MMNSSVTELKKELNFLPSNKLIEACLKLAKFKKENKELLNYLLFFSHDEEGYVKQVNEETRLQFGQLNRSNDYLVKKGVRKILKNANKYIKISGRKDTEANILIFFCRMFKEFDIRLDSSLALYNLYSNQIRKCEKAISKLHEDLQYDYHKELNELSGS